MNRRGFTLIEMAIVMSCAAVIIPATYLLARSIEGRISSGAADLDFAAGARAFSQELRRDLASMSVAPGEGLSLEGSGACTKVRYVAEKGALWRRGEGDCGDDRAVAPNVSALVRESDGVRLVFAKRIDGPKEERTTFLVAVPGVTP